MQQPRIQQQPIQQQPLQAQQMQMPPFGTQGGTSVYQNLPSQNSPQPTGQSGTPQVAQQPGMQQPGWQQPVLRVATAPSASVPAGQSVPLYAPGVPNQPTQVAQPGTVEGIPVVIPQGMTHMGRAEPANRIVPFFLNDAEQRELDEFLARWERYSGDIKRYDVEFNMLAYDPTIPGAVPNVPHQRTFGNFKYIANPMRFVYVIEGEWRNDEKIKRDDGKNQHIFAEKIIINEKSVFKYEYNSKTVYQVNVPPEMIGKGIADSPLPLIFGAKADELKRRFSMKIIPRQDEAIWLIARPLLVEDQQEFKELEILINRQTLHALGLKQTDINGKAYKVYELRIPPKINDRLNAIADDLKAHFTPDVPRGWKHDVHDWTAPSQPPPASGAAQPQMGNPMPPQVPQHTPPQQRNEVPLYERR
jgi:TIGR03009 family protein